MRLRSRTRVVVAAGALLATLVWAVWQPVYVATVGALDLDLAYRYGDIVGVYGAVSTYRIRYLELAGDLPECCASIAAATFVQASRPRDGYGRAVRVDFDRDRHVLVIQSDGYPIPQLPAGLNAPAPGVHAVLFVRDRFLDIGRYRAELGLATGTLYAESIDPFGWESADWRRVDRVWMSAAPPERPSANHTCLSDSEIAELGAFEGWEPHTELLPVGGPSAAIGLSRRRR